MKLSDINKDQKIGQVVAFYLGKEYGSGTSGLYYIEKDEYIPLPNKYYVSTYVWSTDRGKTWTTEKLDYIRLFTDMPKNYYGGDISILKPACLKKKITTQVEALGLGLDVLL